MVDAGFRFDQWPFKYPLRMDFSRAEATLIALSGRETSMSFLRGVVAGMLARFYRLDRPERICRLRRMPTLASDSSLSIASS